MKTTLKSLLLAAASSTFLFAAMFEAQTGVAQRYKDGTIFPDVYRVQNYGEPVAISNRVRVNMQEIGKYSRCVFTPDICATHWTPGY